MLEARFIPFFPTVIAIVLLQIASPARGNNPKGVRFDGEHFVVKDGSLSFQGVVIQPSGKGPFPAILISHGLGGDGERFGRQKAREFVKAGYICISPDYAHVRGGDRKDFGASAENIRRAEKCLDILESMKDVDSKRLFAYGNSMGAFLTIGLAAEEPKHLAAAAITAGGIAPVEGQPAPSKSRAAKIKIPILILHGTSDTTVPPERSQMLEDVLQEAKTPLERKLFDGAGHDLHAARANDVNALILKWFDAKGRKHKAMASP